MNPFLILMIAILSEVIATISLKASDGFTRLVPSMVVVVGYAVSFYTLSLALKQIELGLAYAIWSGIGTVGTVIIGYLVWKEVLNVPQLLGIGLIIVGVVMVNLFGEGVG